MVMVVTACCPVGAVAHLMLLHLWGPVVSGHHVRGQLGLLWCACGARLCFAQECTFLTVAASAAALLLMTARHNRMSCTQPLAVLRPAVVVRLHAWRGTCCGPGACNRGRLCSRALCCVSGQACFLQESLSCLAAPAVACHVGWMLCVDHSTCAHESVLVSFTPEVDNWGCWACCFCLSEWLRVLLSAPNICVHTTNCAGTCQPWLPVS